MTSTTIPFALTGLVFAGWLAAPAAQQEAPGGATEPAHKVYVLNGCLEKGATTTSPFKLTRAVAVGRAIPPAPAAADDSATDVYELHPTSGLTERGVGREALDGHVGQRVEVTIRPEDVPPPAPPVSSAEPVAKAEPAAPQRYRVTEIAMVAGSCG